MQTHAEPGLREVKKRATRAELTRVARRLLGDRGLDGVTVEQIATEAGVSARTFFNYFDSKEAAVLGGIGELSSPEGLERFLEGGPTGNLFDDIVELTEAQMRGVQETPEEIRLTMDLVEREPRILAIALARSAAMETQLSELVASRDGRTDPNLRDRTVAALVLGSSFRALIEWAKNPSSGERAEHLAEIKRIGRDLFADAVC